MVTVTEGRAVHDCTDLIPPPNGHNPGTLAVCDDCGRAWKLRKVGSTFKEWQRTAYTLVSDLLRGERGICRWAAVGRWVKSSR